MDMTSTLAQLDERQLAMAVAVSKKDLNQINWQINPNDVFWMFWQPIIDKNMGRSGRVFNRLHRLNIE
jgi:hypothetical protein